ncbi:MAG: hypothetical protein ABFS03_01920 [Chloroflexota bacterium]
MKRWISSLIISAIWVSFISSCITPQSTGNINNLAGSILPTKPANKSPSSNEEDITPSSFSGLLTIYSSEPVFHHGQDRTWEQAIVDPGAMLYHDGTFHLFYNGSQHYTPPRGGTYDVANHVSSVGYAVSADGYRWYRMSETPIFSINNINQPIYNARVSCAIVMDDGTWVMYFYTQNNDSFQPAGSIYRATAQSPIGPWHFDSTPVLSPGTNGTWDSYAVRYPDVIGTDDGYIMYYTGIYDGPSLGPNSSSIGMATSIDGISWTKKDDPSTSAGLFVESDPVFRAGTAAWAQSTFRNHRIWQTPEGWFMIYAASSGYLQPRSYGVATSQDGITWHHFEDNPIFTPNSLHNATALGASDILYHNGKYYFYFNASKDEFTGDIYLAISE